MSSSSDSDSDSMSVGDLVSGVDTYTETTAASGGRGGGGSVVGALFGLMMFVGSFPLLFWNEGRAVERYEALKEGAANAISVAADPVAPANEGRLIHVSGLATTDETLRDAEFQVSAPGLRLQRVVKMYQWEERKETGDRTDASGNRVTDTTYTYEKTWSEELIKSSGFKKQQDHTNPASMPYRGQEYAAGKITLGAYTLSPALSRKLNNWTPLPVDGAAPAAAAQARPHDGGYYIGADPAAPAIGDLRITFRIVKPADVTVVAKQARNTFEPYVTRAGGQVEELRYGAMSSQALFQAEQEENTILTWVLRAVGFFLMLFGTKLIMNPIAALASFIPVLGEIVAVGTFLIALLASLLLSSLTIAVAWFFQRPVLTVMMVALAVAIIFLIRELYLGRRAARAKTPGMPAGQPARAAR